jgi:hypothetical protein
LRCLENKLFPDISRFIVFLNMSRWLQYLIPSALTALLFILLAGLLGGTFDYFFAPPETNHDKTLTDCILGMLLPLLLTGLYLPLLLLWPVQRYVTGLPHTSLKPGLLFMRMALLLALLNPLTLLWLFSMVRSGHADTSTFLLMLLALAVSASVAAYAGIFIVRWRVR